MLKFNSIFALSKQLHNPLTTTQSAYKKLIHKESEIGSELFGPIPKGHRREFFCLDERTWVWHEEWYDNNNNLRSTITRYEIYPDKFLKIQNGQYYQLDKVEADNFYKAVKLYNQRTRTELYPQAI